jgi:hypothetical protein
MRGAGEGPDVQLIVYQPVRVDARCRIEVG